MSTTHHPRWNKNESGIVWQKPFDGVIQSHRTLSDNACLKELTRALVGRRPKNMSNSSPDPTKSYAILTTHFISLCSVLYWFRGDLSTFKRQGLWPITWLSWYIQFFTCRTNTCFWLIFVSKFLAAYCGPSIIDRRRAPHASKEIHRM